MTQEKWITSGSPHETCTYITTLRHVKKQVESSVQLGNGTGVRGAPHEDEKPHPRGFRRARQECNQSLQFPFTKGAGDYGRIHRQRDLREKIVHEFGQVQPILDLQGN